MAHATTIGEVGDASVRTRQDTWSLLDPQPHQIAALPRDVPPKLLIVIDTEEQFDWDKPLRSTPFTVGASHAQHRAQAIFERIGLKPTYVVDYPVASSAAGYGPLPDWVKSGTATVGAHLHPWVNPPLQEAESLLNSYPGNLPEALQYAKLACLTEAIEASFAVRPVVYKAGRYGIGPATPRVLERLGYRIDASVVPGRAAAPDGGPDFTRCFAQPYWFGSNGQLLEVPLSSGYFGRLRGLGPALYRHLASSTGTALKLPGIMNRLGLLTRSLVSPEGEPLREAKALTRAMHADGQRVFCITYHSPSLEPGHTPYVRSEADLTRFLDWLAGYCAFFMGEMGGTPSTPMAIYDEAAGRRG